MGIGAPNKTAAEIIDKLNKEVNAGLADPTLKARLAELSAAPLSGSPADFGKFVADEAEKWAKVIKFANIKPEEALDLMLFEGIDETATPKLSASRRQRRHSTVTTTTFRRA
jgi:hypothetical protein